MNPVLTLRKGELRCDIVPSVGGCLSGLWLGETPVLRPTPAPGLRSALDSACYPLVPYSNRIGHAQLQWAGAKYALAPNFPPEPHAIHGTGWEQPWSVLGCDAESAVLSLAHRANAGWPFDFRATQTLRLQEHALAMELTVTNLHPAPVPVGLGWHPYFVKRPSARICFEATGRWEMGPDQLPTELQAHGGLDMAVQQLDVDHCFEGWTGALQWADGALRLGLTSDARRLVVFTRPELDCIAIEPVSHANNAFNRLEAGYARTEVDPLGVRILAPGQSFASRMVISVQRAP